MEPDDDPIRQQAAVIAEYTIPELNRLTLALAACGVAATFTQYIPELHDEVITPEDSPSELQTQFRDDLNRG
jgi:hypothetical protein